MKNNNPNKIKVIEFITSMGDGGAQVLIKDYALCIDKSKFDLIILCLFPMLGSGPGQIVIQNKIPVVSIYPTYSKFWSLINKLLGWWLVPRKLNQMLSSYQPDVIHAHLGVLKYLAPLSNRLPKLFYTCHSEPIKTFKSYSSSEFLAAKELVNSANMRFIALHTDMQLELNKLFGVSNTSVVHNGIDIQRFTSVKISKKEIRAELGIPSDAIVIGNVGRFLKAKNHNLIVDVFKEIKRKDSKAYLLLIGSGPLKKQVEENLFEAGLSQSYCILEDRADVERLLKAMDVFIFPSLYEGLGIALIEAQAAGLHCVASSNVPQEAFLSPKLKVLSLDQSINDWVDAVLDLDYKGIYNRDISIYDMKKEIKVLEYLYEGSAYGQKRI